MFLDGYVCAPVNLLIAYAGIFYTRSQPGLTMAKIDIRGGYLELKVIFPRYFRQREWRKITSKT